jgi:hypothetical protein
LFPVNNATFQEPAIPVLLKVIGGASTPQELLPPGDVIALPPNKVIEINLPGGAIGSSVSNKSILCYFIFADNGFTASHPSSWGKGYPLTSNRGCLRQKIA